MRQNKHETRQTWDKTNMRQNKQETRQTLDKTNVGQDKHGASKHGTRQT